jgi:uncharacterized protein GlcG (DUF336 family)
MPDRVRVILKCVKGGEGVGGVGVSGAESGMDDLVGVEANVRETGRKKAEIGT